MIIAQQNFLLLFLFIGTTHAMDNGTTDNPSLPLSQLAPIVGYDTATKIPTMVVTKTIYDMYQKIITLPYEIQNKIVTHPVLNETYRNIYLNGFKRMPSKLTRNDATRLTSLSSLDENTIAIAQPLSCIQIWSLKNNTNIFTSKQEASQANLYYTPLLLSSSLNGDSYVCSWNTRNNYAYSEIETDHPDEINLLFSGPHKIISCGLSGTICIHDIHNLTPTQSFHAHDGQIFVGTSVSAHSFMTGSIYTINEWDYRMPSTARTYDLPVCFTPSGLQVIDEHYIVTGGTQKKLCILDRRKTTDLMPITISTNDNTAAMEKLRDNTLVFGGRNLHFATYNNNTLTEEKQMPIHNYLQAMTITPNETIVYADRTGNIFYIKRTIAPFYRTQNISIESCIMALSLDEINNATNQTIH